MSVRLASGVISLALVVAGCTSDGQGESHDTDPPPAVAFCKLGAKALSLAVGAIKGGEGAGVVLGLLEPAVAALCTQEVNSWIDAPSSPVSFTLVSNNGELPKTLTFDELVAAPPPTTTSVTISDEVRNRIVDCAISYFQYAVLNQWCLDHVIEP